MTKKQEQEQEIIKLLTPFIRWTERQLSHRLQRINDLEDEVRRFKMDFETVEMLAADLDDTVSTVEEKLRALEPKPAKKRQPKKAA